MYTVSKGPSKIVAKTRRGISQNLDRLESRRDRSRKTVESDKNDCISSPKPVFHCNGKKAVHQRIPQDTFSPEHEEMIRFIDETWKQISSCESELQSSVDESGSSSSSSPSPSSHLYYKDAPVGPGLGDFKPFDLESWWGKRLFHNITNSS